MPDSSVPPTVTGLGLLSDWANRQDNWIRALVAEVIETQRPLASERVGLYFEAMLREKELAPGAPLKVTTVQVPSRTAQTEEALVIQSMSGVENVNALATGQTIEFNPQLTILFGENGAGKTGYVRILKSVAAVRTAEVILPDVQKPLDKQKDPQRAILSYRLGKADPMPIAWSGERGLAPLTRMDVFDAASVDIHVDGSLEYVYTPSEVAMFGYAHDAIKAIKDKLEASGKAKTPRGSPFLDRFSREGKLYNLIETLGAATLPGDVKTAAAVTKEEEAAKGSLEEKIEALRPGAADARLQLANSEKALLERASLAIETVGGFSFGTYADKLKQLDSAKAAERNAATQGFKGTPIPGIGRDTWQKLIAAADSYIQAEIGADYPKHASKCVYCLQPLEAAALHLVRKYRALVRGEAKAAALAADLELTNACKSLGELDADHILGELTAKLQAVGKDAHTSLRDTETIIRRVVALQRVVASQNSIDDVALESDAARVATPLKRRLSEVRTLAATLTGEVGARKELLEEAATRLRDLKDRMALRAILPDALARIEDAKWAVKATAIVGRLTQVAKTLTEQSKAASAALLNKDFQTAFRAQCGALRAPPVTLKFPGGDGRPARQKSLAASVGLRKVLSEGEQKVIALADFLAEAELRKSAAPIVFDDPVTSLDYRRVDYVVTRLLALSEERQVIVFTHNIMFTMKLLEPFTDKRRKECTYYDVSDEEGRRGIIRLGLCPQTDTWNDRKGRVEERIRWAKEETHPDKRLAWIVAGYDSLRGACEIVVEQDVLKRVVQSYRPNVMVGKLRDINIAALHSDAGPLNDLFDKCCRIVESHKQPDEAKSVRPKLEDLETDWKQLTEARKKFA